MDRLHVAKLPLNGSALLVKRPPNVFDASGSMDRLRSSMLGEKSEDLLSQSLCRFDNVDEDYEVELDPTVKVSPWTILSKAASQIPAIILIGMFHLMIGIPFGVSYFPIGWREAGADAGDTDDQGNDDFVNGAFPLPGKEALGIRMFLFATAMGQVVFTLTSGFKNPIGLQMVENVPFCHALSRIVIARQGYGAEALSTLFVLFSISSIMVGSVFMILGRLNLGRVVYYFPNHVLIGCIAGIGVFLVKTGVEVAINTVFSYRSASDHSHLVLVVIVFEGLLRMLETMTRDSSGRQKYALLSPIYFCMITPMFYIGLWLSSTSFDNAMKAGYFFPSLQGSNQESGTIFDAHVFDMWAVIDFSTISWRAIFDSVPTLVALVSFSLIHVPINLPAFALSTNVEVDMNVELRAHGWANLISGFCGGLQNYLAYTQSVLYDKSGGMGKASGIVVAVVTGVLFFVGPLVASYIPRCMAGTLLVHVGIDLFLEGVYDTYSKFDGMEYASVWLITLAMTFYGMDAAMITGVFTAIFVYVAQNMTYVDPVRGHMCAATLRSDVRNRNNKAREILADPITGRNRILVVQLQGHLFFGNVAHLSQKLNKLLSDRAGGSFQPLVVIIDFSLVLGIDSSAAQAITKLKTAMQKHFDVILSIFVSGSDSGFPCEFDLSKELCTPSVPRNAGQDDPDIATESTMLLASSHDAVHSLAFSGSYVCNDLNMALINAENCLVARQDPGSLGRDIPVRNKLVRKWPTVEEERSAALRYLRNLSPAEVDEGLILLLLANMEREAYTREQLVWRQGSSSTSMKLIVSGSLIAVLENEAGTSETINTGNTIGESGLLEGAARMSSVRCLSDEAVLYSLSRKSYDILVRESPHVARLIDLICISYLSARVQHVSNRIFETRCLPI